LLEAKIVEIAEVSPDKAIELEMEQETGKHYPAELSIDFATLKSYVSQAVSQQQAVSLKFMKSTKEKMGKWLEHLL
jgi:hypothetical protein